MENKYTPDQLREKARQKERDAVESFDRCDTDGFISQWSSGLSAERLYREAQILEDNGLAVFPALFDLDGNYVPARLIDGRYGECWAILDTEGIFTGEFVTAFPARRATMAAKGYLEGYVKRPARAKVASGRGGMATAYVTTYPTDSPVDAPAEIVTSDRWAD
jgi:hypothetical protein